MGQGAPETGPLPGAFSHDFTMSIPDISVHQPLHDVRACAYVSPVSYYLFLSMVGCYSHYNYDGETKSPEDGGEDERQVVSDISSLFSFNLA